MTTACTDLTAWPQLPSFKQMMPEKRPPRYFSLAVFVSVVIHAFLAFLLWVTLTNRMTAEPAPPLIGTPLTVKLVSSSTLAVDSHDVPVREPEPTVSQKNPPEQRAQPSPIHKIETETVLTSKEQGIPDSETPAPKSLVNDATPPIDLAEPFRIAQDDGKLSMSVIDAASILGSKELVFPGSEALAGKSPGTDGISSFNLEASYGIAREVGRMSMSEYEIQESRYKLRTLYLKNHSGIVIKPLPYCGTLYQNAGIFVVVPLFIKNTITDSGCTWQKSAVLEKQSERPSERHKDEERVDSFTRSINEFLFSVD